jgi:hypothetical protein
LAGPELVGADCTRLATLTAAGTGGFPGSGGPLSNQSPLVLSEGRPGSCAADGTSPPQLVTSCCSSASFYEEHFAHWVGGIVDLPAEGESDAAGGEVVADDASIGDGTSQSVQFGHDQRVTSAHGGERLIQAGACPAWFR